MKKLIYLLLALPFLFTACTDIDPAETAPELLSIQASEIEPTSVILTCKTGNGNTSWGHVIVKTDDEEEWREFGVWGSEEYDDDFIHGNRTYTTEAYGLKPGTTYRAVFCYSLESYLRTGIGAETTFTTEGVSYKVVTTEPTEVSTNSAFLTGYTEFSPNEVKNGEIYFKIAWDANFEDYETVRAKWSGDAADDRYYFYLQVNFLNPGRTYWVQAIMTHHTWGTDDAVMGNVISFTTPEVPVKNVVIDNIEWPEGVWKAPLTVYIQDTRDGKWFDPMYITWVDGKPVWKEDIPLQLYPNTAYFVRVLGGTTETFDNTGYVAFGSGSYNFGEQQYPIYTAVTDFNGSEPVLNLSVSEWTAKMTVVYPAHWGKVTSVDMISQSNVFPGNAFYLSSLKALDNVNNYHGRSGTDCVLNDKGQYEYTFNIYPCQIPAKTVDVKFFMQDGRTIGDGWQLPEWDLKPGGEYVLYFNGLGVGDVSLTPWVPNEGGSVDITPNR